MTDFETVVATTQTLLQAEKEKWEPRYGDYIEKMEAHQENALKCYSKFQSNPPFSYYITTGELKDSTYVFHFSMRHLGQEVAVVKVDSRGEGYQVSLVVSKKNQEGISTYFPSIAAEMEEVFQGFEVELQGKQGEYAHCPWDSKPASDFRETLKRATEIHSKSVEHSLEHQLYKELGEKHGRSEKLLKHIRPMMLGSLRFPMTTPLSASEGIKNLKCTQGPGGGIDILASFNGNLTVIELKDENKPSESPKKTMEQALAYATFLHSLLRSERAQGKKWYEFFGYERAMPKEGNLTINVVVAMPFDATGNGDKSIAFQEIILENGDKFHLHYMYLKVNPDTLTIEEIDTSLKPKSCVTILRGSQEIGGSVTEIVSKKGTRILVDMGSPLPGGKNTNNASLPLDISGVTSGEKDCDGILLTHYHGDHIGMIGEVLEGIPLYLGKTAKEIALVVSRKLEEVVKREPVDEKLAQEHGKKTKALQRCNSVEDRKSFTIKDMKITPFWADHSAFDSYMYLIEFDGIRLLHTGDFRLHGYGGDKMWDAFEEISKTPLDYLICEGTTLSRRTGETITEQEVSRQAQEHLQPNFFNFVLCSSTNIDHIAGFYAAMPDGMSLICDKFQKDILDVVAEHSENPFYQFKGKPIMIRGKDVPYEFGPETRKQAKQFCALVRSSSYLVQDAEFMGSCRIPKARLYYGLWSGYLEGEHADANLQAITKKFADRKRMITLHSSGHVYREDLERLFSLLQPKKGIIPIHTENQDGFREISGETLVLDVTDQQVIYL